MQDKKVLSWLFGRLHRRIPAMAVLVVCHILGSVLSVLFALGTRQVIDAAVGKQPELFVRACVVQGILIVAVIAISALNNHLRERLLAVLDRDWKKDMLHGLLRGEYAQVSRYHTGELLNRMNNDVRVVNTGVLSILPSLASMLTSLVAALSVMLTLAPGLTAVVVAAGIVVVAATGVMRRYLKRIHKKAGQMEGKVSGFIQETLENLLMVQAMDIAPEIENRADKLLDKRFSIHTRRKNISVASGTCVSVLSMGAAFGTLVWCAGEILQGRMTYGTMTAITQLVTQLRGPFMNLSSISPQYAALTAAAERLMELSEVFGTQEPEKKDGNALYENMTAIRARGLTFGYDREPVFDRADFVIPKGSFGVITGHSGIGKSTLLKLLLGVFRPQEGTLVLCTPEGDIPTGRNTQGLFAYVPQGKLLLSGTLRENLTVTRPMATEEEIRRAVAISCMDEFLPSLPQGLETVLGENALGLSEGQAQRLSIARAVLSGAPVLLLDEATSALDEGTEREVLTRLKAMTDTTVIAVTHRPAAMDLADWSLEMDNGSYLVKEK